ncbi:MAG: M28 family peptidase [Candidatus Sericytochromatia bacterium]|nr:M28 family peptidase [Candidatus Tanganyikabacteria bacterium]
MKARTPFLLALLIVSATGMAARANPAPAAARPLFDGQRAWKHLEAQLAFGPRCPGCPGHARTRAWLVKELRALTPRVTVDEFTGSLDGKPVKLFNIIADIGPAGPRPILLGAHWDTRPWAERDPDPARRNTPIPGANDGASGVAVLLEVARVVRPNVPVRLVFFDGEDLGQGYDGFFQGSRRFADRLGANKPRWGLIVDMVGDADLRIEKEEFSRHMAAAVVERVWNEASRSGYARYFKDNPGPRIFDDHWPLLNAGVQVADLIDFDYPWWHTTYDTAERCSPASLEVVGRVVVGVVEAER